jgi:hypothetical protein
MQYNLRQYKWLIALGIILIVIMVYFFQQEASAVHLPRFKVEAPLVIAQPPVPNIVDRVPLVREDTSILPANEVYKNTYKDWAKEEDKLYSNDKLNSNDKLYSNDAPLFPAGDKPAALVAPNVNSPQRRVNFVEVN